MRPPRLLAVLATIAMALAATGCGVPDHTDVVVDGEGQQADIQGSFGGEGLLPPGPEGTSNNIEEFVRRYLEAPAGDWEGAADRVKQFLSPKQGATWQAPKEITVVRLVGGKPEIKPAPSSEVVLDVQQIGVLASRGALDPPTSQTTRYTFTVGTIDGPRGGLAVLNPPPGVMLLTDTALNRWYEQRPIYFWDTDQRNLVPDLRYLPRAVAEAGRPKMLIDWLIGGPADWLRPGVLELPDGTKQLQNAYKDDDHRLIVNLSDAVTDQSRDRLVAQLCWTLRDDFTGDLVLQIEFQQRAEGSSSEYFDRNPAYRMSNRGPELFTVAGGVVHRAQIGGSEVPAEVPLVEPAVNKDVRYAAISDQHAALVRVDGDELRLWVGPDAQGRFVRTSLRARVMSRPVLAGGREVGYLAAGGTLYQFSPVDAKVAKVNVAGLAGPVTSVALAPDGRRLAVVADGRPYLVALGGDGAAPTGLARPVPAPLGNLTGISWLGETRLTMTGSDRDKAALVNVTMDGAVVSTRQDVSVSPVTQLVSFPENPVTGSGGHIMIEADGRAYEVYTTTLDYVRPDRLPGPPVKAAPAAPFFAE